MTKRIAIIGAGFGGLALAHALKDVAEITVFEKARGAGGRMSTRYADPYYFDHGAQCFTARTESFRDYLRPFLATGTVAEWQGNVVNLCRAQLPQPRIWYETHLVACPNMNSLCKSLLAGLDVKFSTEIVPLAEKHNGQWALFSKEGLSQGVFDWVISTAPPAQTLSLFHPHVNNDSPLHRVTLKGCYAMMLGFNRRWDHDWIAARIQKSCLKWISVNSSKPGRNADVTCLVVHSRNEWAEAHMNDDMEKAQAFLLAECENDTGLSLRDADFITTHRWRYSVVDHTEKSGPYCCPQTALASTSDWCLTSRIEEVWLSAMMLAEQLRAYC